MICFKLIVFIFLCNLICYLHKSADTSLSKVGSKSSWIPISMSSSQGIKPLCLIAPMALPPSRTYPILCRSKTIHDFCCLKYIESTVLHSKLMVKKIINKGLNKSFATRYYKCSETTKKPSDNARANSYVLAATKGEVNNISFSSPLAFNDLSAILFLSFFLKVFT